MDVGAINFTKLDMVNLGSFLRDHPGVVLSLRGCFPGKNLDLLRFLPPVRGLAIHSFTLADLDGLQHLNSDLEVLDLRSTTKKSLSLGFLSRFPRLRELYLEDYHKDFEVVSQLQGLEELELRSVKNVDIACLIPLAHLCRLKLKIGSVVNFHQLARLKSLKYLEIWQVKGVTDLSPIGHIASLQFLFLQSLRRVVRLPPMRRLLHLRRIHLDTMRGLVSISGLRSAPALEDLVVAAAPLLGKQQFRPLAGHPTLKHLGLYLDSKRRNDEIRDLLRLPDASYCFKDDDFAFK